MATIDLTKGIYRRVYAGARMGHRINSVSEGAEMWFWRLNMVADDFGNGIADPVLLAAEAGGRRKVSPAKCKRWVAELVEAELIDLYEVNGDPYFSIRNFTDLQPAGKSGRRVQKYPLQNPEKSGDIRNERNQSTPAHTETESETEEHKHKHSDEQDQCQVQAEADACGDSSSSARAALLSDSDSFSSKGRALAMQVWLEATSAMWSKDKTQWKSDRQSACNLFDAIWPDGCEGGQARANVAMKLITEARKPGVRNGMSFLTRRVQAMGDPR